MSLLDDVSIVVTPNGYKAGTLYGVLPTYAEGAEEVTNGDFATDSDWTFYNADADTNTRFENNSAILEVFNTQFTRFISTTSPMTLDKFYKITYEVTETDNTDLNIQYPNTSLNSSIGTHTVYIKATNVNIGFSKNNVGKITIDNVSVKEYTSADMDVTRATAATRVDEDGLVNYALGVEEVTNGDFSNGSTDWTPYGSTFVVSNANPYNGNDTALFTGLGVGGAKVTQSISTVVGNTYHLSCYAQYNSGDQTNVEIEGVLEYPNGLAITSHFTTFTFLQTSFTATSTTSVVTIRERGGNNNASCYLYGLSVKEVNNVPRIDYTGGGCPHILAEPQRTNELVQSNQFDTTWVQSGTLTSGQDGVGGSTDAWKFENPNSTSSLYQPDTTSGVQTLSAYFKKNSNYGVRFYAFGSVNCWAWFDLNNGTVVSTGSSTAKIETAGDDWFRCSMTFDQTNTRCDFYVTNNASTQVLGNYTIQYAQLEQGSYETSYIPTSGGTVIRNKDILTRDGIGSLINDSEGVLFAEIAALSDDNTDRRLSLNDGSANNEIRIGYSRFTGNIISEVASGGIQQNINWGATGVTQTNNNKFALSWGNGTLKFYVNGSQTNIETGITSPVGLNTLKFSKGNDIEEMFAKVKQLQVYKTALTDEQLLQLTGTSGTDFYESYAEMASALTYTIQ